MYIDLLEIELQTKMYIELIGINGLTMMMMMMKRTSGLTDRQVERNGINDGTSRRGKRTSALRYRI